ncbi:MAG: hypothetical protein ACI4TQ_05635, partial [Alloprevotella sp.]
WDRMYDVNRQNEAAGGETLYYQERRHNDQMVFALNSAFSHDVNRHHKYTLGVSLNSTKGMHYKTMADLLGGTTFTDIDKFAANDYGINSTEAQNDLRNPNRKIGVDDKFGYNYNIFVNKARAYGLYEMNYGKLNYRLSAFVEGTTMEREGLMQNGRAPENSYGKSGQAKFLGGGGRFGLTYRPTGAHILSLNFGAESDAPLARNSFVAPRMQNNFVDNLTNEQIFNAEASYQFRIGDFSGKVTGYYTRFNNGVEQTAFYNDQEERFTYLTMSGVDREHYGVEAALKYNLTSNFSVSLTGTYAEAQYVNNPLAQVAYEGMNASTLRELNTWSNPLTGEKMPLRVIADGMRVNGTPLTAVGLGLNYNVNGWFFEANLNYYDRVYVDFSEYRRLSNVLPSYSSEGMDNKGNYLFSSISKEDLAKGAILYDAQKTIPVAFDANGNVTESIDNPNYGQVVSAYSAEQEKFDGGFMLDLSIGRYIRLAKGKSISINLNVQNVTNNRNLRTGGYEQNRDDF